MSLPATQLSDTCLFPTYNNVTIDEHDEQLRIGVPYRSSYSRLRKSRTVFCGGATLTLTGNDGKTPIDLVMEPGHEKAALLLGEGITKRFKQKRE